MVLAKECVENIVEKWNIHCGGRASDVDPIKCYLLQNILSCFISIVCRHSSPLEFAGPEEDIEGGETNGFGNRVADVVAVVVVVAMCFTINNNNK